MKNANQLSKFDSLAVNDIFDGRNLKTNNCVETEIFDDKYFVDYTVEQYSTDVERYNLNVLWTAILDYMLINRACGLLKVENLSMLYEFGLAIQNKINKKDCGQYFTPDDVSCLMARWFKELKGDNICDVGCGTGNLILAFLKQLPKIEAEQLLCDKRIYLYDCDSTALKIAQYRIAMIYGIKYLNSINLIHNDFLNQNVSLPENSKVISNPPYAKINKFKSSWQKTENLILSSDYYSAIMEKIVVSGAQAVIITPYSFLGGNKFYQLRKVLNDYSGFIVAFDNVPGNIFNGKKHGIFNSNSANSVRAAITVVNNTGNQKGFNISHLIRFKTEEREKLLDNDFLEDLVGYTKQTVSLQQPYYIKCHKKLQTVFDTWVNSSDKKLIDLLNKTETEFCLYVPNTCRYFTTASTEKLNRVGMMTLYAKDSESFDFLYCLLNSSFAYWHWRAYDGGITYPIGLLNEIPVFERLLSEDDRRFFADIRKRMSSVESQYKVTKLNAGKIQENIKFPSQFRKEINARFFRILGCNGNPAIIDIVHSNSAFSVTEEK